MKVKETVKKSCEILKNAGIQSYVLDTQLLLAHFLGKSKLFVITNPEFDVSGSDEFFDLIKRRENHEPVQYITGRAEFMSLEFKVNKFTLIPRPDTEILVEYIMSEVGDKPIKYLDIGTGSGCIAVSIAKYCNNAKGTALDISDEALKIAKENAITNVVDSKLQFIKMDILSDFPKEKYDIVVSNPPYIERDVIPTLMDSVKNFEPYNALFGGDDGLDFYRRISSEAKAALNQFGIVAFEVGHTQSEQVSEILKKDGYENIAVIKDLSGIKRVVAARYPG